MPTPRDSPPAVPGKIRTDGAVTSALARVQEARRRVDWHSLCLNGTGERAGSTIAVQR